MTEVATARGWRPTVRRVEYVWPRRRSENLPNVNAWLVGQADLDSATAAEDEVRERIIMLVRSAAGDEFTNLRADDQGGRPVPASVESIIRTSKLLFSSIRIRQEWGQVPTTSIPRGIAAAFELTDVERDRLIRSVIASQSIEDVHVSYELASRLLDEVLLEPLPHIG